MEDMLNQFRTHFDDLHHMLTG